MTFYPLKINQHFLNPRNAGEIELADAVGTSASFVCGAALQISLKIKAGTIVEAKFKAAGCGYLIAAADVLTEKITGKEFAEIGRILREKSKDNENSFELEFENEFPANRKHCLELCKETLQAAVNDFRTAQLESWQGDEALICTCFGVSEKTIESQIIKNSLTTVEEVTDICNAGGGCGSCQPLILDILEDVWRGEI